MIENMIDRYCLVRTDRAGVFAGLLKKKDGNECLLHDARRIWYWKGAASLSQLAMKGTSKPQECKFPAPVDEVLLLGVIEIIPLTYDAQLSIRSVPIWQE